VIVGLHRHFDETFVYNNGQSLPVPVAVA
jgi:hypothetical protein